MQRKEEPGSGWCRAVLRAVDGHLPAPAAAVSGGEQGVAATRDALAELEVLAQGVARRVRLCRCELDAAGVRDAVALLRERSARAAARARALATLAPGDALHARAARLEAHVSLHERATRLEAQASLHERATRLEAQASLHERTNGDANADANANADGAQVGGGGAALDQASLMQHMLHRRPTAGEGEVECEGDVAVAAVPTTTAQIMGAVGQEKLDLVQKVFDTLSAAMLGPPHEHRQGAAVTATATATATAAATAATAAAAAAGDSGRAQPQPGGVQRTGAGQRGLSLRASDRAWKGVADCTGVGHALQSCFEDAGFECVVRVCPCARACAPVHAPAPVCMCICV